MKACVEKNSRLYEEFQTEWASQIITAWEKLFKSDFDKNRLKKEARSILSKEGEIVYKYSLLDESFRLHQSYDIVRNAVTFALGGINPENKIVLDFGCGPYPENSFKLSNDNKVICADLSPGYLLAARRIGQIENRNNLLFVNSDADQAPFKKEVFDLIIFSEILEHLFSCETVLEELRRILKKDGMILLTTPNRLSFIRMLRIAKDRISSINRKQNDYFLTESHSVEYSFSEFKRLIKDKFRIRKLIPVKYNRGSGLMISIINFLIQLPLLRRYSYSICVILEKIN
jgi:ubiquinone/menaquinone biosynthesis C-methylase UbiE